MQPSKRITVIQPNAPPHTMPGAPAAWPQNAPSNFHVLSKPSGATCNLECMYCFFLSKEKLYPDSRFRMPDELLEAYIRQLIEAQRGPLVTIAWQGGEPTLMGLDFYKRSIDYEKKYVRPGLTIEHTMQTRGKIAVRGRGRDRAPRPKRKEPTMGSTPPSGFGLHLNGTLEQQVSLADAKLSGLIGFSGLMLSLLLAEKPSFPASFVPNLFEPLEAFLASVAPVTYSLALLSLLITAVCAFIGFYSGTQIESQENVVFWRWIGIQPLDKYQSVVNALTESAVEDAYARENHRLSKRLRWRNRFIQYSAIALLLSLLFGAASTGASFLVK